MTQSAPRLRLATAGNAFDLETALASAGGDREFLEELLGIFLGDVPRYMAAARAGLAGGELARVVHAAHALRGAGAQLGASALSAAAFDVERAAAGGTGDGEPVMLDALERAVDELFRALGVHLSQSSSAA